MKNIYVCGPTVYSKVHIGNMRPILTFDTVIRAMKFQGQEVNFIHNITDIDDKIIKAAAEANTTEVELSSKFTRHYKELLTKVNVNTITVMPTVTDNMKKIVSFISSLVEKGAAYEDNGNVWYKLSYDKSYGSVSNRNLEDMNFSEEYNKEHPGDFALWKKTDVGITFDSPWGKGRPGWHTECCAFIDELTNSKTLDIHGGGVDLLFPHHENEATQYRSHNNKEITKDWKRTGHIKLDGTKMSKSIGNIFDAEEFINQYSADTLRLLFISSSYSAPQNLTEELLSTTSEKVEKIKKLVVKAKIKELKLNNEGILGFADFIAKFEFSKAMKILNEKIKDANKGDEIALGDVVSMSKLIGLKLVDIDISVEQKQMFKDWEEARLEKDYDKADLLRDKLTKLELI